MAWGKGGSKTLDATATQFDITGLSSESTNLIVHSFPSGASAPRTFEVNGTSGTYDVGNCDGGGAIGHSPNYAGSLCDQGGSWGDDAFIVGYMMSIEGKEKIMIYDTVGSNSNGTAPRRRAWASRSNSNTGALTSVTVETSGGSGSIAGSNFSILGSDKTPTLGRPINIQDNSILVEKDIGNRYWRTPAVSYTDEDITWDSTTAVNVSISGNTATATGSTGWDKASQSTQTWTPSDEPTLEFTVTGSPLNQMMGFGKGTLGTSYTTLDYALYTESGLGVYESGVQKFADSSVTPSSSDTFKVTMDSNGLVKYWRNGSVFYTSLQTASGTYYAQFTPKTSASTTTMTYSSTTPAPATWTKQVSSTPPTVAGLTLHLDSSDASTITKDGSNLVSAWNDKSGQANHITQATGSKQPLWVDRVQDTLPIIRFDGTDDFLKIASWSGGALATSTSYMVFKPDVAGTQTWFDSAINRTSWHGGGGSVPFQLYSGAVLASSVYVADGETIYCQIVSNGASSIIRRDGITIATGNAGSQSFNGIYLGSGQNTGYSEVDVAELLVYEGTHSTSDRDVIEAYLKKKWGL